MLWDPIVVALTLGLVISGALWFIFIWPGQEPEGFERDEHAVGRRDTGGDTDEPS